MGVWDRLVDLGKQAQEVTQEQAKRTQLKLKRRNAQNRRKEAFQVIGEALYPQLRDGELEATNPDVLDAVDRVRNLDAEIERLHQEEADLRADDTEAEPEPLSTRQPWDDVSAPGSEARESNTPEAEDAETGSEATSASSAASEPTSQTVETEQPDRWPDGQTETTESRQPDQMPPAPPAEPPAS